MNIHFYGFIFTTLLCFACKNNAQNTIKTAYLAKNHPDKLAIYKQQQHRFNVDFCKLYYNDKQVILDSTQIFNNVFGENFYPKESSGWYNKKMPILARATTFVRGDETKGRYITKMSVQLNRDPEYIDKKQSKNDGSWIDKKDSLISKMPLLNGYLLIDGILVDGNTKIEDFNELRERKKLPLYTQNLGNIASQGITYDVSYCKPLPEMSDDFGYTNITLYYNEEDEFEETHRRTTVSYTHLTLPTTPYV